MTKYVVPIDTPPVGADWQAVVPGIYEYDVLGITADLATNTPAPAPQQLMWAGFNLGTGSLALVSVGPYSTTENVLGLRSESPFLGFSAPFPSIADNVPHMFAWVWDGTDAHYYLDGAPLATDTAVTPSPSPSPFTDTVIGPAGVASTTIDECSGHRAALSAGQIASLYAAGLTGFAAYSPAVLALTPETYYHLDGPSPTVCVDASGNGNDGTYGTSIGGTPSFVPGLVAGNDALRWSGLTPADETNVQPAPLGVDWTSPFTIILWSLQEDSGSSTGRQPSLLVTDGTNDVLLIPTGFAAVSTPGPYSYAWQPGLNADTQSSDGTLTTVAIPRLILPPGYTVGTRTLDLTATDQWSNVSLWWDDTYQKLNGGTYDYGFPPGRFYVYQRTGSQP